VIIPRRHFTVALRRLRGGRAEQQERGDHRVRVSELMWARYGKSPCGQDWLYDGHMRFALALALALGLAAISAAAQRSNILTNGRNLQIPINHGLPDTTLDFTFCRLRYDNIRRARKSGWGDDYPQADFNFMVRLSELTKTKISRGADGDPRLRERHRDGSRSLPVSVLAHAERGQLRLHARRNDPHARLPAEGRLSLDRRQLGSGLRVLHFVRIS
jgi:hypothetical protein